MLASLIKKKRSEGREKRRRTHESQSCLGGIRTRIVWG